MQCLEFRRSIGAEPGLADPAVVAHAAECPACADYRRQMRALDRLLHRALEIPVPTGQPAPVGVSIERRDFKRRWLTLAASVLLAAGIGFGLWSAAPRESLATTVIEHLSHEPEAMLSTADRVSPFELEKVLAKGGIRLRSDVAGISYARSCPIRGHLVPHLVVQTEHGPVTVLVMAQEQVGSAVPLAETGLTGAIVPAGPGSIAVIGEGARSVDEVRRRILEAVEFLAAEP